MNPHEQQERHRSLDRINQRIDTLAESVDAEVSERVQELRVLVTRVLSAERDERLAAEQIVKLAQLATYGETTRNTRAIVALNCYSSQFLRMDLRERLRWLLLGQLPEHLAEFSEEPDAALLAHPLDT